MPALEQNKTRVVTLKKEGNRMQKMSHNITVTRTTTTTTTSAIIINSGYVKTFPGILKLLEVIIGAVALFLFSFYSDRSTYGVIPLQFFFCAITAVFLGSFCLFLSCIISLSTASIIAKTIYEFIYHLFAFLLITAASLCLVIEVKDWNSRSHNYQPFFAAAVMGLILSVLYFLSTVLAYRSYKGRL